MIISRLFLSLRLAGALCLARVVAAGETPPAKFYDDDPLWKEPPPLAVEVPHSRKLSDYYDFLQNTLFRPGELQKRAKTILPARGVNTLGEVPDSPWYSNRHYHHTMSIAELVRGPGNEQPPSDRGCWKVVAAKNEGVTPGFTIVDERGRKYILKFDPADNPELASAADVISSKFFYALGYNVPENYIVTFERSRLVVGERAAITDRHGNKREMTEQDLERILRKARADSEGRYRALASRYLPGQPLGPFRFYGTRSDDPNDTVPHEHRRELRGLRVFAAWLAHDDSRAINTLDMLVRDAGVPFIRHYLIDFGSTLGSDSYGPNSPRSGNAYLFAWRPAAAELFSLGLYIPRWQRARYPNLPSVGRFESAIFDPERWVPEYPNSAFSNMNPDDAFWAARQVMAFTDEQIRAVVATGRYSDPAAAEWVAQRLMERRDKVGKAYFTKVLPLDRFEIRNGQLRFENIGTSFDIPRQFKVQWSVFDNTNGKHFVLSDWNSWRCPQAPAATYLVAKITGRRPGQSISVYVRTRGGRAEVIGVERTSDS